MVCLVKAYVAMVNDKSDLSAILPLKFLGSNIIAKHIQNGKRDITITTIIFASGKNPVIHALLFQWQSMPNESGKQA